MILVVHVAPTGVCPPGVCGLFSSAAGSIGASLFSALTAWLADAASWSVGHVLRLVNAGSTIQLSAGWFTAQQRSMFEIMAMLLVPLLGLATIGAIIRQDARRLLRAWAVGLPVATVGSVVAVKVTAQALEATDQLCRLVLHAAGPASSRLFERSAATLMGPSFSSSGAAGAIVAVLFLVGAFLLWLELVLREATVYLAVFFLPLALAGLIWPATAHWARRLVEVLAALILSKFVVVAALALGVGLLGNRGGTDQAVAGAAMLLLAAFAPFTLLRVVPFLEVAAISHLEGVARRPVSGARRMAAAVPLNPTPGMGVNTGPVSVVPLLGGELERDEQRADLVGGPRGDG